MENRPKSETLIRLENRVTGFFAGVFSLDEINYNRVTHNFIASAPEKDLPFLTTANKDFIGYIAGELADFEGSGGTVTVEDIDAYEEILTQNGGSITLRTNSEAGAFAMAIDDRGHSFQIVSPSARSSIF